MNSSWLKRCGAIALVVIFPIAEAVAQACPSSGTPIKTVKNTISDIQKNGRAPYGADCAFRWVNSYEPESPLTKEEIDFFKIAADVQRRASEMRATEEDAKQADEYLANEIAIRQRFLKYATTQEEKAKNDHLNRAIVIHLSSAASAMGSRGQYSQLAEFLAGQSNVSVIDDEAVKIWLQAVWSCAKWDGQKDLAGICLPSSKSICKDRANELLSSVAEMKARNLPIKTERDLGQLRFTSTKGCLQ